MIILNNEQLKRLSEVCANLSLFFFGTVITPAFTKVDRVDIFMVILGLGCCVIAMFLSLLLLKGNYNAES